VVRLYCALARLIPQGLADEIMADAGARTGAYIVANRIPAPARILLRALPKPLAARLLVKAIAKHAWTFAGSGAFSFLPSRPSVMEIADNPLAGPRRAGPSCVWHAAVFTRLFRSLVSPDATVRETACCAAGDPACRFEMVSSAGPGHAPVAALP
jgi:divinyl protochlorophyllide a 8-vinyl-reductase